MFIRTVDDSVDGRVQKGPADEDRVPLRPYGTGWLWLKRSGAIAADITEVHVATVESEPVVQVTLTQEARAKLVALTRVTRGHHLAFVLNNSVVINALIAGEPDGLGMQIAGNYTEAQARRLAEELKKTIRPTGQRRL
jgi:preprotein translocase subunit SecD